MLKGRRIALVEDDEIMGASIEQRLRLEGLRLLLLKSPLQTRLESLTCLLVEVAVVRLWAAGVVMVVAVEHLARWLGLSLTCKLNANCSMFGMPKSWRLYSRSPTWNWSN